MHYVFFTRGPICTLNLGELLYKDNDSSVALQLNDQIPKLLKSIMLTCTTTTEDKFCSLKWLDSSLWQNSEVDKIEKPWYF